MVVAQFRNKYTEKLMALQSLQYDGNSLEKSRHSIVSQVMFRRHKYSFHLAFVFFNLICLKDGTDGSRCLLLNPLKGEAMMLPTMLPSVQVPENLNPKSFEYWYGRDLIIRPIHTRLFVFMDARLLVFLEDSFPSIWFLMFMFWEQAHGWR